MSANGWEFVGWAVFFFAILFFPVLWTTWRARRLLRRSLGREIRDGEENSLSSWMRVSGNQLDAGVKELEVASHQIVALGEGPHGNVQGHELRLSLVRHPGFAAVVNDIVVEFGSARYQDVMDRFVGELREECGR